MRALVIGGGSIKGALPAGSAGKSDPPDWPAIDAGASDIIVIANQAEAAKDPKPDPNYKDLLTWPSGRSAL